MPTSDQAGQYEILMKMLLIGDSNVGKTCLLLRFSEDQYQASFITTIGIDFKIKICNIDPGFRAKLQVWDTAGQERFRTITQAYYRGADGILLTYDVTSRASFDSIRSWVTNIKKHAAQSVVKILIGTKCDCEVGREVSVDDGQRLAQELGVEFLETSAKSGHNVEHAFLTLGRLIRSQRASSPGTVPSVPLALTARQVAAKHGCRYC